MPFIIVIGIVAIALSVIIRGIYLTFTGEKGCKDGNGSCPFLNDEEYGGTKTFHVLQVKKRMDAPNRAAW